VIGQPVGTGCRCGSTNHKGLGLRQRVGDENAVLMIEIGLMPLGRNEKVTGHHLAPLVNQLVEGVLAVRPRLTPDDGPDGHRHHRSIARRALAMRLQFELLQIGRQTGEALIVG